MRFLYLALLFITVQSAGYSQDSIIPKKNNWKQISHYVNSDKTLSFDFGGRIFVDYGYLSSNPTFQENFGELDNRSQMKLKSAELNFKGTIYQFTEFNFKADFAGNKISVREAYIGFKNIPAVGTLRVGYQYEPFRFISLSSGKFSTFIERAGNHSFSPKHNLGVLVFNSFFDDRVSAQLGAFNNGSNFRDNLFIDDGYAITTRITAVPYLQPEKNRLLHLGVGLSYRKPNSKEYIIDIPIGSYLTSKKLLPEITADANTVNLVSFETVYIHNAVSLQSEYLISNVRTVSENYHFWNYYAQLSWFITGEHKNYRGGYSGFGRLKPKRNFGPGQNGAGAWEIGGRYSKTNLTDGDIRGGIKSELRFGVNWYLNPNTRLMMNYVHADIKERNQIDIFQARLQVDF